MLVRLVHEAHDGPLLALLNIAPEVLLVREGNFPREPLDDGHEVPNLEVVPREVLVILASHVLGLERILRLLLRLGGREFLEGREADVWEPLLDAFCPSAPEVRDLLVGHLPKRHLEVPLRLEALGEVATDDEVHEVRELQAGL